MKNTYKITSYLIGAIILAAFFLTACPLPYKYTPEGYPGTSTGADPSTPDISAAPVAFFSESSGRSGTVADGGSASTSSDTKIDFSSATVGAVIYYTVDGTTPDPRSPNTRKYAPGSPLRLAVGNPSVDTSSASVTARATAIGPNMKPSLVSTVTVSVQYPQAAAPTFSLPSAVYAEDQLVELSTATPDARIYYTKVEGNGPAPRPVPGQQDTLEYTSRILVSGPSAMWTIAAIAVKDQLIASPAASATYMINYTGCAEPVFTPPPDTYFNDIDVAVMGQEGSTIHYSFNGTNPDASSSDYCAPGTIFQLPGNYPKINDRVLLKALATAPGHNPSQINTAPYVFRAATVQPSMQQGTYHNAFNLSLSTQTLGAQIYYTTDGSNPNPGGMLYLGPFTVSSSQVVRAVAVKDGYLMSSEWSGTYTLESAVPNFTAAGGVYHSVESLGIVDSTSGATIYFTADGTDPKDPGNPERQVYAGSPLSLSLNGTWLRLRAYAHRAGFLDSEVAAADYFLALPAPRPFVEAATSSSIDISVPAIPCMTAYNVQLFRGALTQIANSASSIVRTDTDLSPAAQYQYWTRIYYFEGDVMVESPNDTVEGWTLDALNLPIPVSVTVPGPYATPGGYMPGFFTGPEDGANIIYTVNLALRQGGYIFIPYSWQNGNPFPGTVRIAAFDCTGAFVRSFDLTGARYVYAMAIDGNGNITYYGQANASVTVNWSTLRF